MLTKREARAILAARDKIARALDQLERTLSPANAEYAKAYYVSHTRSIWRGVSYGSAPILEADEVLG